MRSRYKCPKCGFVFEGQVSECPNCHQTFKYSHPGAAAEKSAPAVNIQKSAPAANAQKSAPVVAVENSAPVATAETSAPVATTNNEARESLPAVSSGNAAVAYAPATSLQPGVSVVIPRVNDPSKNSGLNATFNFFWFIFVGLWSIITNVFLGIGYCFTIIGIPFGIACFKFIPVVAKPAGREVMTKFSSHPFLNTVALLVGGWVLYLVCLVMSIILTITIIGYPLARQLYKISTFFLAPFGSSVVYINQYTDDRDTQYDLCYFLAQVYAEDKEILLSDGSKMRASQVMKASLNELDKSKIRSKLKKSSAYKDGTLGSESSWRGPRFKKMKMNGLARAINMYLLYFVVALIVCLILQNGTIALLAFYPIVILFSLPFMPLWLDHINKKKKKTFLMPYFTSCWKYISCYYPTKVDSSLLKGKKMSKDGSTPLAKYQCAKTIDDMILSILDD